MQMIDFVRAKFAAGGELKIDQMAGIVLCIVGLISVLRIQRAVSVGNMEESVGLGALKLHSFFAIGPCKIPPESIVGTFIDGLSSIPPESIVGRQPL